MLLTYNCKRINGRDEENNATVHALIGKFVSLFNWAGKLGEKLGCTRKKHFTSLSENRALLALYSTVPLTGVPFVFRMLIFAAIKASKRPANQSAQTQRKKILSLHLNPVPTSVTGGLH